ncbi:glycosyltransferase [uncultured Bacteroides sp.]|uniref:glycosyltransferase n=1 Tax=uncultured Bacteroides sp. TaxID=162156 RepID=UPI002674D827|nr:glycosyltransferase [uncultured Bacteroides sp.]
MRLVFYSIILNHHQVCVADEFYRILGKDYIFVELTKCNQNKGATEDFSMRPYLIQAWKSTDNYDKAMQLVRIAEVCVFSGYESLPFQKIRMKLGLLSFDMGERWLKKGVINLVSPRILKMFLAYHIGGWKNKTIYKLCCSAFARQDMNFLGMYKEKCYKWGYFTNVDKDFTFRLSKQDVSSSKSISLMWCARFLKWKHPELPVLLAAKLMAKGYKFTLDMYGDGIEFENIKKLARNLFVEDVVSFKGSVPNEQVIQAMRTHDIFLFTSDNNEGWGAVANEAMSNGCCLVGSDEIGCVPYLVADRKNGLIFKSCAIESLTDKVIYLMDHPEELYRFAEAGVFTMQYVWSPECAAMNLLKLINSFLNGQKISIIQGPCSIA